MPIIKSAKKRARTAHLATVRNARMKRKLREATKQFQKDTTEAKRREAEHSLDTAVKKHIMHKNKAARLKSHLAAQAKAAGTTSASATKKTAKKPATKTPATAKKSPAKPTAKATAQKAPAKKTTPKQSSAKK
jgi:ribosomal protein S20